MGKPKLPAADQPKKLGTRVAEKRLMTHHQGRKIVRQIVDSTKYTDKK